MASCRDPEGWGPISRIRSFDTTPCFEEGVILPTILAGFICFALLQIGILYTKPTRARSQKSCLILWAKLALLLSALAVSLTALGFILLGSQDVAILLPHVLEPTGIIVAMVLTYLNHTRARTSATLVLLFWPLYTIGLVIRGRTAYNMYQGQNLLFMSLQFSAGLFGLASLALECLGPYDVNYIETGKVQVENPLLTANIFSKWSFDWLTPLMQRGAAQFITEDDLPPLKPSDESDRLGSRLEDALKRRTLWKALFVAYGGPYIVAGLLKLVQDCLAFLQPQLLRWLLAYIARYQDARFDPFKHESPPGLFEGFLIAFLMFTSATLQSVTLNQYFQRAFETGMRVRAGLVTAIYKKALVLSNDERSRATGDIVNLMSVDASRLQDLCTYGLISVSGPFQITLAFISLYNLLGWSAFVGVGVMILSIPLNTLIARTLKKMQEEQMKNRDKRTRLMTELLNNIKSIKLYAWEFTFMRKILETRNNQELKMLKKIGILMSFNMTLWTGIPLLVAFSSFAMAALTLSRPLTADIIFPAISLFMLLQFPLAMMGQVTSNIVEAVVSVQRLSEFLNARELQSDARTLIDNENLKLGDEVLVIEGASFTWSSNDVSPTLEGVDLTVKKGELVGVFGRVGAGKTSLLSAITGDMLRVAGELRVRGSIAYASQNAWIMSATVRENILFSHEYDEVFYNLVIEACALSPDLALLPQGDLTEVGEKGITLSGGQRARIALARAVYARSDLVLLDDCLAAVDSHVARHVFNSVIGPKGLLASKARILVTNSISFVKQFDQLVYLRRGIVLENGTYESLMSSDSGEMSKLIRGHGVSQSGTATPYLLEGTNTPVSEVEAEKAEDLEDKTASSEKTRGYVDYNKAKLSQPPPPRSSTAAGLSREHLEQGQVKSKVYKEYISAASVFGFSLFLLTTISQQGASLLATLTLRYWGDHNRAVGDNSGMLAYLTAYGLFSLLSTLLGGVSSILMWVFCGLRSAKQLHDSMLDALLRAPLSFFELTPIGRVLNLFSKDTYVVDQILARVIQQLCRTLAVCLSIIVVIGFSFPLFLLFVFPLGWFYLRVMRYYLATSRELKRLDAVSRSPIFAWFSESLAGTSIIRAFSQQAIFTTGNQQRLDRNQICYLPSIYVNRWLAVRLEFVGAMIIFIVALLAIFTVRTTHIDAGLVGMVISYALNTTSSLNWVVRSASEVEQNIVSVERILHQTEVKPEAPLELPERKPVEGWPSSGEIEFKNYSTRYRPELDLVLKDISIKIKPSEKIGICGRTGAGKSSVLLALFRVIEPVAGTITIDGVNTTEIGLHDLRSAIAIVPQTPDLFEGTLRENVDPVGEYKDADIWIALEQAHLKSYVESLPEGLDAPVREGGASLSSGQRQLLCFARALLRKSKIFVLDEATSAVDLDTDQAIQAIIQGPIFKDVTILTIAHRLNTIMKSDRILVMDSGRVAEFDSPERLLSNPQTIFYSLAREAGLVSNGEA